MGGGKIVSGLIGGLVGLTFGVISTGLVVETAYEIRTSRRAEPGYAVSRDVKIKFKNLDTADPLPETYIEYKGQSYLLKLDENGRPRIVDYKFVPASVVEEVGK